MYKILKCHINKSQKGPICGLLRDFKLGLITKAISLFIIKEILCLISKPQELPELPQLFSILCISNTNQNLY